MRPLFLLLCFVTLVGLTACDRDLCDDTCYWPDDGECDDGGEGSDYDVCDFGTDCTDCGVRTEP